MLSIDELAGSGHALTRHAHTHAHGLHAIETLAHTGGEVAILGVWGCFFERAEVVFAFVVFFFPAVAAVWAFGAVATIVGSAMSVTGTVSIAE